MLMEADSSIDKQSVPLERIGFSSYEAKLYVTLIKNGPQSVGTLSSLAGVPRTKAYGALKRLIASKMVISSKERPQLFYPSPPSTALSPILQRIRLQAYEFEETYRGLQDAFELASRTEIDMEAMNLWVLRGRQRILDKASEMLNSVHSKVEIATTTDGFIRLYKASWRALEKGKETVKITATLPKEAREQFILKELQTSKEIKFDYVDQFPPILALKVDSKTLIAIYGVDEDYDIGILEDGILLYNLVSAIQAYKNIKMPILVKVPNLE
jgi:sugar-specific transcriptional regulator TrmB